MKLHSFDATIFWLKLFCALPSNMTILNPVGTFNDDHQFIQLTFVIELNNSRYYLGRLFETVKMQDIRRCVLKTDKGWTVYNISQVCALETDAQTNQMTT